MLSDEFVFGTTAGSDLAIQAEYADFQTFAIHSMRVILSDRSCIQIPIAFGTSASADLTCWVKKNKVIAITKRVIFFIVGVFAIIPASSALEATLLDILTFSDPDKQKSFVNGDYANVWDLTVNSSNYEDHILRAMIASSPICKPGSNIISIAHGYEALNNLVTEEGMTNAVSSRRLVEHLSKSIDDSVSQTNAGDIKVLEQGLVSGVFPEDRNLDEDQYPCNESHLYRHSEGIWKRHREVQSETEFVIGGGATQLAPFLCTNFPTFALRRPKASILTAKSSFGSKTLLSITTKNRTKSDIDHEELRRVVIESIALVRDLCLACDDSDYIVLEYNDKQFIHSDLDGVLVIGEPPYRFNDIKIEAIGGAEFTELTENFKQRFCSLERDKSDKVMEQISTLLECDSTASVEVESSSIILEFGVSTQCDAGRKKPVACATRNNQVQFNVDKYNFLVRGKSVVGNSSGIEVNMYPVMIHESAHWLGVGHNDAENSIMNGTIGNKSCIDDEAVFQINAAIHAGKPATTNQALFWQQ